MVPGIIFACRQITWSHHFFSVLSGFNGTIFAYGQVSRTVPFLLTCLIWCIFFYPFFINIFKKYCCKHIAIERRAFNTKENLKKIGKLKKWEEIWEVLSLVPYHWWLYLKMQEQSFILRLQYYNCEVENFVFANVEKESNNMLSRSLQCCKEPFTNSWNPDFVLVQEKK